MASSIGRLSAILSLNASQFHAGMDKAQKRMGKFRKGMNNAARNMALPLTVAGGAMVKAASDIEKGFIGVKKTTGLSDQEIAKLKESLLEFSTQNNVAQSALIETAKVAGQMGIEGQEAIGRFAEAFSKLEIASDRTVAGEEGAQAFSKFLELSKEGVEGAESVASALVELGNTSKTTEGQVLSTATEIVKKTSRFNIGAANILGFATALDESGVKSEVAGSTFQKFFENLDSAVKTGGEKLEQFGEVIGKTPEQIKQALSEDPAALMQDFLEGLNDLNTQGADTADILQNLGLGGLRASSTLQVLADRHGEVSEKTAAANEAQKENTALQAEANEANKGFDAALQKLKNSLGAVAGSEGFEKILNALTKFIEFLPTVLDAVANFGTFIGETAAKIVIAFQNMKDDVVEIVGNMIESIKDWFSNPLGSIVESTKSAMEEVVGWFQWGADEAVNQSIIPDMVVDIGGWMDQLPDVMGGPAETASGRVTESFRTMRDSISTLLSDVINGTKSFGDSLKGILNNIAGSVLQTGIDKVSGAITEGIASKISGSSGFLAGAGKALFGGASTSSGAGQAAAGAFTTSGAGGSAASAALNPAVLGPQIAVLAAPFIARELVGGGNLDKEFAKFQGFSGTGGLGTQVGGAGGTSFAGGPASGFAREFAQSQGVTAFTSEGSGLTAFKTDLQSLKKILSEAESEFESLKKSAATTFNLGEKGAMKVGQAIKDGVVSPTELANLGLIKMGEKITHAETGAVSLGEVGVEQFRAIQRAVEQGTFRLEALRGETMLNQREIAFLGQQGLTAAQLIQGGFSAAAGGVRALRDESVAAAGDMANAFRDAAGAVSGATFGGDPNSARDPGLTQQLRNDARREGGK